MTNYTIRRAISSDYNGIINLIKQESEELSIMAQKYLNDAIRGKNLLKYVFYIAELNNKIIGVMGYRPDKDGAKDIYWAVWLFVDAHYRRKYVARNLWKRIEKDLVKKKARKCYLDVGNENQTDALNFHKNNGFKIEGYLIDFWDKDDHMIILGKEIKQ